MNKFIAFILLLFIFTNASSQGTWMDSVTRAKTFIKIKIEYNYLKKLTDDKTIIKDAVRSKILEEINKLGNMNIIVNKDNNKLLNQLGEIVLLVKTKNSETSEIRKDKISGIFSEVDNPLSFAKKCETGKFSDEYDRVFSKSKDDKDIFESVILESKNEIISALEPYYLEVNVKQKPRDKGPKQKNEEMHKSKYLWVCFVLACLLLESYIDRFFGWKKLFNKILPKVESLPATDNAIEQEQSTATNVDAAALPSIPITKKVDKYKNNNPNVFFVPIFLGTAIENSIISPDIVDGDSFYMVTKLSKKEAELEVIRTRETFEKIKNKPIIIENVCNLANELKDDFSVINTSKKAKLNLGKSKNGEKKWYVIEKAKIYYGFADGYLPNATQNSGGRISNPKEVSVNSLVPKSNNYTANTLGKAPQNLIEKDITNTKTETSNVQKFIQKDFFTGPPVDKTFPKGFDYQKNGITIFEFNQINDNMARYSLINDETTMQIIRALTTDCIKTACLYDGTFDSSIKSIVTITPGTAVRREGDNWIVENPAEIEFKS